MKKLCYARLGLLLLLLFLPILAFAQDFEYDGIWYTVLDEKAKTCKTRDWNDNISGNNVSGDIVLPETVKYNGETYSLIGIGYRSFYNCNKMTSISIPNTITTIWHNALQNCSGLTSITLPNSINNLGEYVFAGCTALENINVEPGKQILSSENGVLYNYDRTQLICCPGAKSAIEIPNSVTKFWRGAFFFCSNLTSVNIPNSVTSIAMDAFNCCSNLKSINIPSSVTSIGVAAFNECSSLTSIDIPNSVTSIEKEAFSSCSSLTSIKLPDLVKYIGSNTFSFCSKLTSVDLPNSVTSIGDYAFYDCNALTSITIPNSVTSIGDYAFSCCRGLTSITIPNSVTSIGDNTFCNCISLISITMSDAVTSIGEAAFGNCSALTSITLPNSVTSIGVNTFCNCISLISITMSDAVTSIGKAAFGNCRALTSITLPNSVTSIGEYAFNGCSGLNSITLPNSVTTIGEAAFSLCSSLASITIPNSVTSIGDHTFSGCSSLTSITIPNSVTTIGECAFSGCNALTSITIPSSVTSIGYGIFLSCNKLETIIVEESNKNYSSQDGVLFNFDKTVLVCFPGAKTEYVIPNSVASIDNYAFCQHGALTSIIIPNSVTSIGDCAFYNCSDLTSIILPNSLTSIGSRAFYCKEIKDIYYLADDPIAGENIFNEDIFSTAILHVPASALEKFKSTEPWMNFANIDTNYSEMMSPIFNEAMGDVITIGPNSTSELAPTLHAFGPAKGVQFDLTLPKGLSLTDITATGADSELSGLTASHAKLENGDFRVLIYTNDGAELGNLMLGMSFESDATLERGDALCHNIIHSIFDTEVTLDDETAFVTGYDVNIPALTMEELESYTLSTPVSTTIENVSYRWGEVEPVDVAEFSAYGIITAKAPGEAVYSLYVKDGDRPEKKYIALLEVVASLWGDADKDGAVNISDLVAVVNYILERSPESFDTRLADIDHNGRINIVDLTGIVKIILSLQKADEATTFSTFSARQELSFGEVETLSDNNHRIALEIEPTEDYTAMQTDIRLPEGVKLENLTIGEGLDGHTFDYAEVDASTVRVIIYSPSLAGLTAGKKAAVAELVLSGELSEDAVISAGETLACDTDGYAYTLSSTEKTLGNTTSIVSVKSGECKAIAVQGGIDLSAPEATPVRISDLSGRCVAETVAPTTVSLAAGVYLVTFENIATLKVIVK